MQADLKIKLSGGGIWMIDGKAAGFFWLAVSRRCGAGVSLNKARAILTYISYPDHGLSVHFKSSASGAETA